MSKINRPIFPAIHLPQFADEPLPEVVTAKLHHPVTQALDDVASATRAALEGSHRFKELPAGSRVAIVVHAVRLVHPEQVQVRQCSSSALWQLQWSALR